MRLLSCPPLYILSTSNRRETVVKNKTNIKITIEFTEAVPASTLCYVILLGEKKLDYDILHERITEFFKHFISVVAHKFLFKFLGQYFLHTLNFWNTNINTP